MLEPKTMISKIRTTRPRSPPPVPYCQALPPAVVETLGSATGAATVRAARKSWKMRFCSIFGGLKYDFARKFQGDVGRLVEVEGVKECRRE